MQMRDLRQALRIFRREPAFAATAVVTLALGIGANTALFAIVEAVLLRPLPFERADDLVVLRHRDVQTGLTKPDVAMGDFLDLRARQRSLESLAGFGGFQSTFLGSGEAVRVQGAAVTPDALRTLRLQPAHGRLLEDDDAREGAAPVAMVSHEFWRTQLGSDPQAVTRSIQLGPTRTMVVGVLPAGFRFPGMPTTDLVVPQPLPGAVPAQRKSGWIYGIGRLRAGQTIEQAAAEMATLSRQFETEFPEQNTGTRYEALSLRESLVGDTQAPAAAAARRRRLRPADGLRQRRQPDARAGAWPSTRVGGAAGAWREPRAAWQRTCSWKRSASPLPAARWPSSSRGMPRRSWRHWCRTPRWCPASKRSASTCACCSSRSARSVIATLIFGGVACLGLMRRDSGALRERQAHADASREIRRVGPGRHAGSARRRPAGGRRADAAEFLQPPGRQSRLHAGRRVDAAAVAAGRPVRRRRCPACVLQPRVRGDRGAAGRGHGRRGDGHAADGQQLDRAAAARRSTACRRTAAAGSRLADGVARVFPRAADSRCAPGVCSSRATPPARPS